MLMAISKLPLHTANKDVAISLVPPVMAQNSSIFFSGSELILQNYFRNPQPKIDEMAWKFEFQNQNKICDDNASK